MTKIIWVVRQTQESVNYFDYVYEAYESKEQAQAECERLNKKYGNDYELGTDLAHFYELDTIELIKRKEK